MSRSAGTRGLLAAFFLLLGLTACGSLPSTGSSAVATSAPGPEAFALSGRLAVRQGEQQFSGRLHWLRRAGFEQIDLASPLGQRLARVEIDLAGARLTTSDGQTRSAPDAASLLRGLLGVDLPLVALHDWLFARPAAGVPYSETRDASGRLERLLQAGWTVEYRYAPAQLLPMRVFLSDPDRDVRLVIESWS
jgi:outer membrane lipoprotein LolB